MPQPAARGEGAPAYTGLRARWGPLAINGRFLGQALSGVQRYAGAMIRALDEILSEAGTEGFGPVELLMPAGCQAPAGLKVVRPRRVGRLRGHAWEQIDLAWSAREAALVNLTNSAPIAHRRQIVTM